MECLKTNPREQENCSGFLQHHPWKLLVYKVYYAYTLKLSLCVVQKLLGLRYLWDLKILTEITI